MPPILCVIGNISNRIVTKVKDHNCELWDLRLRWKRAAEWEPRAARRSLLTGCIWRRIFTVSLTHLSFQRPSETRRQRREAYTKQNRVGVINQQLGQHSEKGLHDFSPGTDFLSLRSNNPQEMKGISPEGSPQIYWPEKGNGSLTDQLYFRITQDQTYGQSGGQVRSR